MGTAVLSPRDLDALIGALAADGRRVLGPVERDGTVAIGDLHGVDDLPAGRRAEQAPGSYRLTAGEDDACFAHAVGADSWKRHLHPPRALLWRGRRTPTGFEASVRTPDPPSLAFVGVRPCDLAAIASLDTVLAGPDPADPSYAGARQRLVVVAANCTEPGGTCFCASMGTGPAAEAGYDVSLTELADPHRFLATAGSATGQALLDRIGARTADPDDIDEAGRAVAAAARCMGRVLDTDGLAEALVAAADDRGWAEVAERCLACGNCTMVCPTCFCSTVEDVTDLSGEEAERWRRWDSCFTAGFSYLHGGSVRSSVGARYRQWATHKLATWAAQFGSAGCVGCGRCITWCPVGIDLTAEVTALRGRHDGRR